MSFIVDTSSPLSPSDSLGRMNNSGTDFAQRGLIRSTSYGEYNSYLTGSDDTLNAYELYSSAANALEPVSSMDSHLSEGRSTSSTQSQTFLSDVVSEYEEEKTEENFIAARMKSFVEATRPGLTWAGGKSHLLEAAQHADKLMEILDNGLSQLLEARREFSRRDITGSNELKLIDSWIWILLQAISELKWPNHQLKLLKEHLFAKLSGLSSDLTHICRLLMTMSINMRIADNLLSEVIRKQNGRFRTPNLKSIMYLKIKSNGTRFRRAPKLRPINPSATDPDCTVKWTPKDGLILLNLSKIEVVKFCHLDNNQKLSLINVFIDEIRTKMIQSAYMILQKATKILPAFRSTSTKFGHKPSLRMKPTINGIEKHILNINALLESGRSYFDKSTSFDDTMGFVLLEYLFEVRLHLLQVIQHSEASSEEYHKLHSVLKKLETRMDGVLVGNFNGFQQSIVTEPISIAFSTERIPDEIFNTFVLRNDEKFSSQFVTEHKEGSESELFSTQTKPCEVKIHISESESSEPSQQQPRLTPIRRFVQWFMRKTNDTA